MHTIGIDLHKRESQVCVLDARGGVTETRILTTRERFATVLAPYGSARILLEASTESEWVATHLESLGHAVIVADPNFAPMYATRTRRVKTDRRDARTLADALRLGAYRPAHRTSPARRLAGAQQHGGARRRADQRVAAQHRVGRRAGAAARRPRALEQADRGGRCADCSARADGSDRRLAGDRPRHRPDHRECGGRHR